MATTGLFTRFNQSYICRVRQIYTAALGESVSILLAPIRDIIVSYMLIPDRAWLTNAIISGDETNIVHLSSSIPGMKHKKTVVYAHSGNAYVLCLYRGY